MADLMIHFKRNGAVTTIPAAPLIVAPAAVLIRPYRDGDVGSALPRTQ